MSAPSILSPSRPVAVLDSGEVVELWPLIPAYSMVRAEPPEALAHAIDALNTARAEVPSTE